MADEKRDERDDDVEGKARGIGRDRGGQSFVPPMWLGRVVKMARSGRR